MSQTLNPNTNKNSTVSIALQQVFEDIKQMGFWQRVFGWKRFQQLSYDAYAQYQSLTAERNAYEARLDSLQQRIQSEQSLTEQAQQQIKRLNEELTPLQLRFESQQQNLSDLRSQHKQFNEQQHTDSRIKQNSWVCHSKP